LRVPIFARIWHFFWALNVASKLYKLWANKLRIMRKADFEDPVCVLPHDLLWLPDAVIPQKLKLRGVADSG
jgi:hypothetical protein